MWIRRLTKLEAPQLEALILALPAEQRRLRFCTSMSAEAVKRYVDKFDWQHGDVFGAFSGLELIGALELVPSGERALEGALEVHPDHQGQGVAKKLVERGILHAKVLGKAELQLNCMSENVAMKRLARRHGMELVSSHGDVESRLKLGPAVPADFVQLGWQTFHAMSEGSRAATGWLNRPGIVRRPKSP